MTPRRVHARTPRSRTRLTMDDVRRFALALPGVTEGRSYGLPALLLNGKFFTRYRKEDDSVVITVGTMLERDFLLGHDPRVFFITDHYRNYAAVLVRLATVSRATLETLLLDAWRRKAKKGQVLAFDAAQGAPRGTR